MRTQARKTVVLLFKALDGTETNIIRTYLSISRLGDIIYITKTILIWYEREALYIKNIANIADTVKATVGRDSAVTTITAVNFGVNGRSAKPDKNII